MWYDIISVVEMAELIFLTTFLQGQEVLGK